MDQFSASLFVIIPACLKRLPMVRRFMSLLRVHQAPMIIGIWSGRFPGTIIFLPDILKKIRQIRDSTENSQMSKKEYDLEE